MGQPCVRVVDRTSSPLDMNSAEALDMESVLGLLRRESAAVLQYRSKLGPGWQGAFDNCMPHTASRVGALFDTRADLRSAETRIRPASDTFQVLLAGLLGGELTLRHAPTLHTFLAETTG
jgi:hypothetical protein